MITYAFEIRKWEKVHDWCVENCDELHISKEDSGLKELRYHMNLYIKHGTVWAGYIELPTIKRHLHVILPNNPTMDIRVVLKAL